MENNCHLITTYGVLAKSLPKEGRKSLTTASPLNIVNSATMYAIMMMDGVLGDSLR